jgi:hypothetical protein
MEKAGGIIVVKLQALESRSNYTVCALSANLFRAALSIIDINSFLFLC